MPWQIRKEIQNIVERESVVGWDCLIKLTRGLKSRDTIFLI
jgi:hypothetical protein